MGIEIQSPTSPDSPEDKERAGIGQKLEGEARKELLEKIFSSGQAVFHTTVDLEDAERFGGNQGNHGYMTLKENAKGEVPREVSKLIGRPKEMTDYYTENRLLLNMGISGVVGYEEIDNTVYQYEPKEVDEVIETGRFFKKKAVTKVKKNVAVGSKQVPEQLGTFTGRGEDSAPAMRIYYCKLLQRHWGDENRPGICFWASFVVDRELGRKFLEQAMQAPALLKEIVTKFIKPGAMEIMERNGAFPADKKILVAPFERYQKKLDRFGNNLNDIFVSDGVNVVGVKPELVFEAK